MKILHWKLIVRKIPPANSPHKIPSSLKLNPKKFPTNNSTYKILLSLLFKEVSKVFQGGRFPALSGKRLEIKVFFKLDYAKENFSGGIIRKKFSEGNFQRGRICPTESAGKGLGEISFPWRNFPLVREFSLDGCRIFQHYLKNDQKLNTKIWT